MVLLFHALILQALITGMAPRQEAAKPPSLEVSLIEPAKPPPLVKAPEPPKLVEKPKPVQVRRPLPPPRPAPTPVLSSEGLTPQPVRPKAEEAASVAAPAPAPALRIPAQVDASSSCEAPRYPTSSRLAGESGSVRLLFLINQQGDVEQSRVEHSSGFERLDEAARDALSLCHFKPGTVDGRPERSWARLDYVWRLK
jgi:protein TonB